MKIRTLAVLTLFCGQAAYAASYGLRQVAPVPAMVGRAARHIGRPRVATVQGTLDERNFQLSLSRSLWMLSGEYDGQPIGVTIDHETKSMLGDAASRRVELAFHWTPTSSLVQGTYGGAPIRYTVDFRAVSAVGVSAGKPFRLILSEDARVVTGSIDARSVRLDYNPMSGRLNGRLGARTIDVEIVNMDLGEFLQYAFVLLP